MQSSAAAFAWEFGWPRRWIPVALGVYLVAHGLLKPLLLGSGATLDLGDGYIAFALVPFSFTFMYFIAVFSFGLNGDLAARQSIYPARLFTLPVSSAELAGWPMACGLAAMSMLWVIARIAALWPLRLDLPIVWPGVMMAVVLAWTQVFMWMPYGFRGLRVAVAVIVLITLDTLVILAINYKMSETALVAFLAPQLPVAYLCACLVVARARRGVVPDWNVFSRARVGEAAKPRSPFRSMAAAQVWFEWRRNGRSLPVMVALVLPFEVATLFITGFGSTAYVFKVLIAALLTPILMAGFTAATVSKANPFARDAYGVTPFTATKPITTVALIAAKLRMAMWSTLATWIVALALIAIGFSWSGADSVLSEWGQWFVTKVGMPRAIVAAAVTLGGLLLGTWMMLVQGLFVGLTGREWLIKTTGIAWLVIFMALGPILEAIWDSTAALRWLWNNWIFFPAILVVLKMTAAIVIAKRLSRSGVIGDGALAAGAASWAAIVFVLYGAFVWWADTPVLPRYLFLLIAILAVPLVRIAAAPLALNWNRHR
ncbi:MAG TPA: hypothetical protein VL882_06260 [Vicinamibacterales bacterium]|nr:hypothetical protein [Vicinamibacterales bacterium]